MNSLPLTAIADFLLSFPQDFFNEIDINVTKGLDNIEKRVKVSNRAHIVFDLHQRIDGLQVACCNSMNNNCFVLGPYGRFCPSAV